MMKIRITPRKQGEIKVEVLKNNVWVVFGYFNNLDYLMTRLFCLKYDKQTLDLDVALKYYNEMKL